MRELFVAAFWLASASTAMMAALNWRRREDSPAHGVISSMGAGVAVVNALCGIYALPPGKTISWLIISATTIIQSAVLGTVACVALVISDRAWRLSRRTVLLLAIEPAALLVVMITNGWHHLFYASIAPTGLDGIFMPTPGGPLYWINAGYLQAIIWGTIARVLDIRRRSTSPARRRVCTQVLLTNIPPILAAFIGPMLPHSVGDLIPLGQAVTMAYLQFVLVRRLPRQIPVAYRQVFSAISAVTVVDREGHIIEVNPAADVLNHRLHPGLPEDLTGFVLPEFAGLTLKEREPTEQVLTNVAGTGVDLHLSISPLFDRRDQCIGWALTASDVTEPNRGRREAEETAIQLREQLRTIKALQANLAEQATRDELTGLHNRRYLVRALEREVPIAQDGAPLSLAIIDLDHFKNINDTFGHGAGDLVLINVAHILASTVRPEDVVARYGGEEFIIVFRGASAESAWSRTDALRERLRRTPLQVDGYSLSATFSAGVAEFLPGRTSEDLLRAADAALYRAKRQGRDRVILATEVVPDLRVRPRPPAASNSERESPRAGRDN